MIKIIPPMRTADRYGSGAYGAPRGKRKHNGIDLAVMQGSVVLSHGSGVVSKIGYPYNPKDPLKGHLRYVQVSEGDYHSRYFYILPSVDAGDVVRPGDVLGVAQGLLKIYPGITDHIHFEVKKGGEFVNPEHFIRYGAA